jgi:hypothetical protein
MGSGKRPKRDAGTIRVPRAKRLMSGREAANVRVAIGSNGGSSNGGSSKRTAQSQCRRFGLVRATKTAQSARAGMHIWGDFNDPRVTIRSVAGHLGDAPTQEARFFINERERGSGGTLTGVVLKSTQREVRVRLCIN